MIWKKIGKALLLPHVAVLILLLPISTALLVYSMVTLGSDSPVAITSYVLSAYTLTVWCVRFPRLVRSVKAFQSENKYARRWLDDERLRVNASLYGSLLGNVAYALFQLWLGFHHRSFWFGSLAAYYISLAVMRFFLLRHTRKYARGEKKRDELIRYRACGWIFLVMNLSLSLMIFFMVYWNRSVDHDEITTIIMAAYTFTTLTLAIVNVVKYRKYDSPIYSAAKMISLAAACVSMLTLESTMLTTFGDGSTSPLTERLLLAISGGAVSLFVITMAIHMIAQGTKKLKILKEKEYFNGTP